MKSSDLARYQSAVRFLEGLALLAKGPDYVRGKAADPSIFIQRTRHFLDGIGAPDKGRSFVHIAGTAGKGSVAAKIAGGLAASGKRTGLFTSPFVTTTLEKMQVNDRFISAGEFADIVESLKPRIREAYLGGPYGMPSYFEIMLAIALEYFARQKCEWVVLEAGLGGRYDATNVIREPAACVITNIDYDHMHILGKTLVQIARDKAGIIKPGSAFFTAESRPVLLDLFKKECAKAGATFNMIEGVEDYREANDRLASAVGAHLGLSAKAIQRGLEARMPCRFEEMQQHPRVVLDGAHNRAKIRATVRDVSALSFDTLHLVIGVGLKKQAEVILEEIVPLADAVYVTRFQTPGQVAADPNRLLQLARAHKKKKAPAELFLDPNIALDRALSKAGPNDLVLATGSFYLAGELRSRWYPEEWVVRHRRAFALRRH